jgi:hypothetical protein
MSKEFSTAAVNYLNGEGSSAELMRNAVVVFYTGTQPSAGANPSGADTACSGTPLVAFSQAAGVITREVRATAVIDFTSTTGNLTALTIGGTSIISGACTYSTPAALATAVAANINAYRSYPNYSATSVGAVVTIIAPKNSGASLNGLVVAATVGAGTCEINAGDGAELGHAPTSGTQVVGVNAANMLSVVYPAVLGSSAKETASWQGLGGSSHINTALGTSTALTFTSGTLTAGYARVYMSPDDPEIKTSMVPTADASRQFLRLDMAMSDMTVTGGTTVAFGATHTLDAFTVATNDTAA